MLLEHFIVLGVARPRTGWLTDVGTWSTSSMLPIEFIRCVSVDEVRARLHSDRRHSAVLLGADCSGLDRDLLEAAIEARCAPIVVTDGAERRNWVELGAACTISTPLSAEILLGALREHAVGVERRTVTIEQPVRPEVPSTHRIITVLGSGGTGTSTTAMALAHHFAINATNARASVALVDASLDADQALLHDLGDVVPGLPELVDLHRVANPSDDEVRNHFWFSPRHGYDVLPGLRRHRDWTALRRRATLAAVEAIHRSFELVIADVDADLEGEEQTGSIDVEERNLLARHLVTIADMVVLTLRPTVSGVSRAIGTIRDLDDLGVDLGRVLAVALGAPRSTRERSELTRTISGLIDEALPERNLPTPVMVPIRRDLEPYVRDGSPPPTAAFGSITNAAVHLLGTLEPPLRADPSFAPIAIVPGHLGRTA